MKSLTLVTVASSLAVSVASLCECYCCKGSNSCTPTKVGSAIAASYASLCNQGACFVHFPQSCLAEAQMATGQQGVTTPKFTADTNPGSGTGGSGSGTVSDYSVGGCNCSCCKGYNCTPSNLGLATSATTANECNQDACASAFPDSCPSEADFDRGVSGSASSSFVSKKSAATSSTPSILMVLMLAAGATTLMM
jgi:hypothetical protein